jgi:anti-sigma factor RsiW
MGNIIRLHGNEHYQAQLVLPWYASGKLEGEDKARFEAHLASCPDCQAELVHERRLQTEVADLPADLEHAWATMRRRIEETPRRRLVERLALIGKRASGAWRGSGPWLGWASAAALALAFVVAPMIRPGVAKPPAYHALSSSASRPVGDLVVVFRPDATEQTIRQALRSSHARLVDGPTAADAYVLQAPSGERDAALAKLRAQKGVVLAEPIDNGESP